MTSEKRNCYLGDPLRRLLERRGGQQESLSAAANQIAARYLDVCRRELPDLERAQWLAICDALNGYAITADTTGLSATGIPLEIADACRINDLAGKWKIDGDALVKRIAGLRFAGLLAILEVAEAFWARCQEPADVALKRALEEW